MQWYDWLRLLTAGISLTAIFYLGRNWVRREIKYSSRLLDFWWAFNAMLFAVAFTMIEKVVRDYDLTWSVVPSLLASVVCLKAAHSKNAILLVSNIPAEKD